MTTTIQRSGLIALTVLSATACAGGTSSDTSFSNSSLDSGLTSDATQPVGAEDSSAGTDGPLASDGFVSADVSPANDAASSVDSAGLDGGAPLDGGPAGESCGSPIDISAGGAFAIDTCMYANEIASPCVDGGGGHGAVLAGDVPNTGATYQLSVPSGWIIQQLSSLCIPAPVSCGAGSWGESGDTGENHWYFVIEPADGTCGATSVTVERM